jgi:hypothetical protein
LGRHHPAPALAQIRTCPGIPLYADALDSLVRCFDDGRLALTTIPPNAFCAALPLDARIIYSQAPMPVAGAPPRSTR